MVKYIKLLIIGLFLVTIADFFTGKVLSELYEMQKCGILHNTNYAFDSTTADILIFGSSRANHHYNCQLIEDSIGLSVYNTGRDGNFIFYQTALLKSVLSRYKPKLILLDFYGSFEYHQSDYDAVASLLPYYKTHPEIHDIVLQKSRFERLKLLSSIYPYNSLITTLINGRLCFSGYGDNENSFKGFVPKYGYLYRTADSINTPKYFEIDSFKLDVFNEFLELTKANDIQTLVLISPVFYLYNSDYSFQLVKKSCSEYNIPFFDYTRDKYFLENPNYFNDHVHLNIEGAELYTNLIIEHIISFSNAKN